MDNLGLVSVIMPSFNTADYIKESIESVIQQTYPYWELIIVDDNSSDDSIAQIQQFSAEIETGKIILIENKTNLGAGISRNIALDNAKGKWIAFLDSDDIWDSFKLEKQLSFMRKKRCHFSFTKYIEIDEKSSEKGVLVSGPSVVNKMLMYAYDWLGCLTVIYDRDFIGNIRCNGIKKHNDYALWLRAIEKANCYLLPEVLAKYRIRSRSISSSSYFVLLKHHYLLHKNELKKKLSVALFLTAVNLFFGVLKKFFYVTHYSLKIK